MKHLRLPSEKVLSFPLASKVFHTQKLFVGLSYTESVAARLFGVKL